MGERHILLTKLKKIIGINANKTKYNLVAHNEIETYKFVNFPSLTFLTVHRMRSLATHVVAL